MLPAFRGVTPSGCSARSDRLTSCGRATHASLFWACLLVPVCLLSVGLALSAADEPVGSKDKKDEIAKRRLDLMKSAIDVLKVSSKGGLPDSAFKFGKAPLLRYNDETRGFLDAGVWRVGENGRPVAFVTIELYRADEGMALLTHEFISLDQARFSLTLPGRMDWAPRGTELLTAALSDAPPPAEGATGRLQQLRQLARRFAVHEDYRGDKVECRLMPAPIDRYSDPDKGIVDGALFAFANGTNPELGLLIECNKKDWTYGTFRMGSAALFVDLDNKSIREIPGIQNYPATAPYTSTRQDVPLPD
jgi:hypothetical protein